MGQLFRQNSEKDGPLKASVHASTGSGSRGAVEGPRSSASSSAPSAGAAASSARIARGNGAKTTGPARKAGGRPTGSFTQHRRLDALRSLLQRHPKGLSIYE